MNEIEMHFQFTATLLSTPLYSAPTPPPAPAVHGPRSYARPTARSGEFATPPFSFASSAGGGVATGGGFRCDGGAHAPAAAAAAAFALHGERGGAPEAFHGERGGGAFFSAAIEADSEAFSALSFAFSSTRAVFSAFA